jgi:hypothetical protein
MLLKEHKVEDTKLLSYIQKEYPNYEVVREIIENVSNNWQVKYKSHFSSNNKPNKPNINRDRFIDLLEEVYVKYNINEENKNKLEQLLDRANWNISNNIPLKLSPTIIEKCNTSGCWLFIYSNDKLIKMI